MANSKLQIKKYNQEGDLAHEYNPLRNMLYTNTNQVGDFITDQIGCDLNNPANIECQPSYDGTVNLIINDDKNPPRIINSRFTVLEDNRYRIINRNQLEQTNIYKQNQVDRQTRLFRNLNTVPVIDLSNITYYGQLMGGNYTFYVKFADNDYNQTDVVCESGQISVFKGTFSDPSSISGTVHDELTDKAITLRITDIDTSFSKIYLYYVRETSDENGARISKAYVLKEPYNIKQSLMHITVNGFEEVDEIDPETLNIKYNLVTAVKTQAQVQNMLFFGNIQGVTLNLKDLQNISLFAKVELRQEGESIGYLNNEYRTKSQDDVNQTEYYNPNTIYYKLGYWPGEIYRLGIVYIMNDDSLSPVFNLRGCGFTDLNETNYNENQAYSKLFVDGDMQYVPLDEFILEESNYLANTKGVFKNPDNIMVQKDDVQGTYPLYYQITLSDEILNTLRDDYGVKGYFIVRQKRIPITLCQGLSIGVDKISYTPCIYDANSELIEIGSNNAEIVTKGVYISESFINNQGVLTSDYDSRKIATKYKQCSGMISVDANVTPILQSTFDGTQFTFNKYKRGTIANNKRSYYYSTYQNAYESMISKISAVFVNSDVPLKYVNDQGFSTRAGASEEVKSIAFFGERNYAKEITIGTRNLGIGNTIIKLKGRNNKILRGVFTPFLGLSTSLEDNCVYNIRIQNFSSVFMQDYFSIRGNDNSAFYAVTNRFSIEDRDSDNSKSVQAYRGDCYTCTVTVRMHRNFIDSDTPVNEIIVDPNCWRNNYNGYSDTDAEAWSNINRSDLNTVPIGTWITYKCLSNYNLGLRTEDRSYVDEEAIMGSPRSFYPLRSMTTSPSGKIEESWVLNDGYNSTLGKRRNLTAPNVPYIKDLFDNRIMFSNVQIDDDFRNAYRIFQGLSYKDIDRQYGAIVKLIPWGVNLFCVFEHGLAILPVNEKALIQTATGQSIHMYGADVLQNQVTLISPDYGSTWQESVVRTPVGIYGVDTYAKKIWRFSEEKGLEFLSDMKVQRFLNDNIMLAEKDKYPTIALKNVKSHFNNYKGDVLFTFYNDLEDTEWHLCYNERLDNWVTRYSWTPLYSENINNIFYTLDKKRAEILAYIYDNRHSAVGINTSENEWSNWTTTDFHTEISLEGYDFYNDADIVIKEIETSYLNENNEEIFVTIDPSKYLNVDENGLLLDPKEYGGEDLKYDENGNVIQNLDVTQILKFQHFYINKDILNDDGHKFFYLKIRTEVTPKILGGVADGVRGGTFMRHIGIVLNRKQLATEDLVSYNELLVNGFYVHGRAGIFDEMNYFDNDPLNQITPTKWYDKQEPFEYEFVVNNLTGFHKIFNDLVIISNNVEPKSLDFEIIGDVYDFNKAGIYKHKTFPEDNVPEDQEWKLSINPRQTSQEFLNTDITYDPILNQYNLVVHQPVFNIKTAGRLLGNIHYKEDSWYLEIKPILYKKKYKAEGQEPVTADRETEVRIRDKFLKIRVKYSGEDLAIITALKTFMTLSHS